MPGSGLWAELEGAAGHEQLPELFCYPAASRGLTPTSLAPGSDPSSGSLPADLHSWHGGLGHRQHEVHAERGPHHRHHGWSQRGDGRGGRRRKPLHLRHAGGGRRGPGSQRVGAGGRAALPALNMSQFLGCWAPGDGPSPYSPSVPPPRAGTTRWSTTSAYRSCGRPSTRSAVGFSPRGTPGASGMLSTCSCTMTGETWGR